MFTRRTRFGYRRQIMTPPETRAYEREVATHVKAALQRHGHSIYLGPLSVRVEFFFHDRHVRRHHTKAPDLDNLLKALFDALNGVLWKDDRQIDFITAAKRFTQGESYIALQVVEDHSLPDLGAQAVPPRSAPLASTDDSTGK